jgi:steroid 5-alpha reductase family enzyme
MPSLYHIAPLVILAAAALVFFLLRYVSAPYGRHYRSGWGPSVGARIGWVLMELPSALIPLTIVLAYVLAGKRLGTIALALLSLWEMHYVYRALIYPFLMHVGEKRFPLSLVFFAWLFNGLNAYANAVFLIEEGPALDFNPPLFRLALGGLLFVLGFLIHTKADRMLRELRRRSGDDYSVPKGWLFDYVVSPNYFGEILEWCGWALACWSLPAVAFAVFTAANLVPRAIAHRHWYEETFDDFPRERKCVIPFFL